MSHKSFYHAFQDKLKELRELHNLLQRQVAAGMNMDNAVYCKKDLLPFEDEEDANRILYMVIWWQKKWKSIAIILQKINMARIEDFRAFVASYQEACERGELEMASEETTRTWINQMLAVFGWDVRNTNYVLQEVPLDITERAALNEIGSTNTRPDYTLMNGRVRLFFLDAKKWTVNYRCLYLG